MNELKSMKEESNNNTLKWLGFNLTKKRAILLRVLCSIGFAFFPLILINSLWVLLYNNTIVFLDDKLTYFYISLLILSNLYILLLRKKLVNQSKLYGIDLLSTLYGESEYFLWLF